MKKKRQTYCTNSALQCAAPSVYNKQTNKLPKDVQYNIYLQQWLSVGVKSRTTEDLTLNNTIGLLPAINRILSNITQFKPIV